jgi:RHS repeat-associated protein
VTGITYPSTATNSFVYNGEDLRVSKTDSAGTSAQITDGTAPASPVLKDARAVYTPGISERAGSTSKFYHGDALGSTRGITNSSQTVTDAVLYDAFGMTVSRTGTTATPFGFVGAQGYQSDGDSGLQLLGHRYYDPSIGRFLSSDPAQAGTNWYAYTGNNPLGSTDPSGLFDWKRFTGGVLAGVAGGIIGGPIGAAVAVGIFEGLYEYGQTGDVGRSVGVGVIAGGTTLIVGGIVKTNPYAGFLSGAAGDGAGDVIGSGVGDGFGEGLTNCFAAGTVVQMAGGKTKPIETVRRGDRVMSRDPHSGRTEGKRVVRTFGHQNARTLILRLASGERITTTPGHPFFVKGKGFTLAGRLAVGNAIVTRAGPPVGIADIETHSPRANVYNFEVADYHTYFVGRTQRGIWVHNDSLIYEARIEPGRGVVRGRPISRGRAVGRVRAGGDVIAPSRRVAKAIAKAASGRNREFGWEIHGDGGEGYRPHFHPDPRTGSHVFY